MSNQPTYQEFHEELDKKYSLNGNVLGVPKEIVDPKRIPEPKAGTAVWYLDIFSQHHKIYYDPMNEYHIRLYQHNLLFLSADEAKGKVMGILDRAM